jgi:iron complex transport system ATP-binding protein
VDTKGLSVKEMAKLIAISPVSLPVFHFSVFDMVLMGTSIQVIGDSQSGKKNQQLVENALEPCG